jgi:hypothetical protein
MGVGFRHPSVVAMRHSSPTGLRHAAQECRALARLSWEPRTTPDPRPITNLNEVPSPERPRAYESPPDGTAWRSGNGMGAVWPAISKGASPRLGTLGLHDGTALWSNTEWGVWTAFPRRGRCASTPGLHDGTASRVDGRWGRKPAWRDRVAVQSASSCVNVIAALLTFLDPLDR